MSEKDKIKLFLNNINKHILKNEISEAAWNSFEVKFAFNKLLGLGLKLEYKRGKIRVVK